MSLLRMTAGLVVIFIAFSAASTNCRGQEQVNCWIPASKKSVR